MKIRNGFVSNSSSSSFICEVCGEEACGMDLCLSEVGMSKCEKGHCFCDEHQISEITATDKKEIILTCYEVQDNPAEKEKIKAMDDIQIKRYYDEKCDEYQLEDCYELPSGYCPICNFEVIISSEAVKFLLKENNLTMTQLEENIKAKFKNYDEFIEFINKE